WLQFSQNVQKTVTFQSGQAAQFNSWLQSHPGDTDGAFNVSEAQGIKDAGLGTAAGLVSLTPPGAIGMSALGGVNAARTLANPNASGADKVEAGLNLVASGLQTT